MRIEIAVVCVAVVAGIGGMIGASDGDDPVHDADAAPPSPAPDSDAAQVGVRWSPDSRLPQAEAGGVQQAEWAAALIGHLDTDGDGSLERIDGELGVGAWGSTSPVVDRVIARYDTSGDRIVDRAEALLIGAEAADANGLLTVEAVDRLRAALGGG